MSSSEAESKEGKVEKMDLPPQLEAAFRNIKDAKYLAMDIGGSLTKIAYYSSGEARIHFVKFETELIASALEYIKARTHPPEVKVTGGGAYKFAELISSQMGCKVDKVGECECIVAGINFLLRNLSDEVFHYNRRLSPECVFEPLIPPSELYPYILVQIGSGVSILKVEGEGNFLRIGGTATGGGTFWGLGRLLTSAKDFDELLELASQGDHRNVDLLVKDIYGEGKHNLDLGPDVIASTFGKLIWNVDKTKFSEADLARSLLFLISNDICQIASLYALLHGIKTIYFGGFFIRHHPLSMHSIDYSVHFWTKGKVSAKFLRHEGYLGAIGAFLKGAQELQTSNYSWTENYFGSTSFPNLRWKSSSHEESSSPFTPHNLEIDRFERTLLHCPLLEDPKSYTPDTVDLTRDSDARNYWLKCFEDSLPQFATRAENSEEANDLECIKKVKARSRRFQEEYLKKLKDFSCRPTAFGNLTVRNLLDLREHCLREFGFEDPYRKQKEWENEKAFEYFEDRLSHIASLKTEVEAHEAIIRGVLAGNVFDWGAKEVVNMMESEEGLNFQSALGFIGDRPWLFDDLDLWLERMKRKPHKCAVIFIDNSGVDVILGILPFVIHLLRRGTEVLLCANNRPVLNDVTFKELIEILTRASRNSPLLKESLDNGRLCPVDSGQGSPCLDLSRLHDDLVKLIKEKGVDLMVLEGMGRAVHTNLNARFNCEVLKVAVLKNLWLANKLGGSMFSVVFKYEIPAENHLQSL